MEFHATTSGLEEVLGRLTGARSTVWERLVDAMDDAGSQMYLAMQSKEDQEVTRQSGNLERKGYFTVVPDESAQTITATSGVSYRAYYGGILNVGAHKEAHIKGYTRAVKGGNVKEKRKVIARGVGFVSPHDRLVNITARPFIQASFEDIKDVLVQKIQEVVDGVIDGL